MIFKNRLQAATLLAERLKAYRGQTPLVLGIPRGAVPMANVVAEALEGDLDVVLVRKLGAPGQPELAIGSIDETGETYLNTFAALASAGYIEAEKQRQLALLHERRRLYTAARARLDPRNRVVIVVDDGLATGSSMIAALRAIKRARPARLVAAVGVAPTETLELVKAEADEVVAVVVSDAFMSVGGFFEEFPQITDDEVVQTLKLREPALTA